MKKLAKPFLKWAGGKRQLLETYEKYYPKELKEGKIENYYEPFVGAGAIFFNIAQKYKIKNIFLYDINEDLILIYKYIQANVEMLIQDLKNCEETYLSHNLEMRSKYYYAVRDIFNRGKKTVDYLNPMSPGWLGIAVRFIFLNKSCFNGLYRVNRKGEFNVPHGKYKNPKICDESNLRLVFKLLQKINIKNSNFVNMFEDIDKSKKSFIYFDPPYRPLSKTSNFTSYSESDFTEDDQIILSKLYLKLADDGHKVMLSNSDNGDGFIQNHYKNFNINYVKASRRINSKGSKRGSVKEVVITNY